MAENASTAQYAPPPSSSCVACESSPPMHALPYSGLDVGPLLAVGVLLVAVGTALRR